MKRSREIIIAVVVLSALGILVYGYNFLKGQDLFSERDYYYAVYDRIEGLNVESPVQVNGFKVGRVTSVELHSNMKQIVVQFAIENRDFKFPANSVARIMSLDLLGSRAIQIVVPEVGVEDFAMPGDTLRSSVEGSLEDQVNEQIAPLKAKVDEMLLAIDTVIQGVQLIFNEDVGNAVDESFEAIVAGFQTFEGTALEIDSLISAERARMQHIIYNIDEITTALEQNKAEIDNFVDNMSTLSDTLVALDIAETVRNTNEAVGKLTSLLDAVERGEGSIGLLMQDPDLYNNLKKSADRAQSLLNDIEENPDRYVQFSIIDLSPDPRLKKARQEERRRKREERRNNNNSR